MNGNQIKELEEKAERIASRVETHKVFCYNCNFGTKFTQDEFDGLKRIMYTDSEGEHNNILCPTCECSLDVEELNEQETVQESLDALEKEGLIEKIPELQSGGIVINPKLIDHGCDRMISEKEMNDLIGTKIGTPFSNGIISKTNSMMTESDWKAYYLDFGRNKHLESKVNINVQLIDEKSKIPTKKEGDAGWDCYVHSFRNRKNAKCDVLNPNEIIGCKLGFRTEIPKGYYAQIVPRSGLSLKYGLTVLNSPGTIDSSYRGEWIAIICNCSDKKYVIEIGDKICQFILRKEIPTVLNQVDELSKTERGDGGFGSTGK